MKNNKLDKLLKTLPIYNVPETGCGHWTDTSGEDNNSHIINIYEAAEILKRIGTDIECSDFENTKYDNIEYYMIYDYTQDQGISGLYIPKIIYDYLKEHNLNQDVSKYKQGEST